MRKRDEWITRIKSVGREWEIATLAVTRLAEHVRVDPSLLPPNVGPKEVNRTAATLPATYFVRLFATFEAGLRQFWRDGLTRDTQPPMRDLIDGVASACGIGHSFLDPAHRVREFRNALVHERDDGADEAFTIGEARRHLTRFFSYLAPDW